LLKLETPINPGKPEWKALQSMNTGCKIILILGILTLLGSAGSHAVSRAEENLRIEFVAIDQNQEAYTVYTGMPKASLPSFIEKLEKTKTPGFSRDKVKIVTLQELKNNRDILVNRRILRKDYPESDVALGIIELINLEAKVPWGLTWNGGIALTYNDYRFAEKSYEKFKSDPSYAKPPPQADPVNPKHHLKLLDPNYRKQLIEKSATNPRKSE